MNNHEFYIRRCLDLATKGLGHTRPNPLVGSVIVRDEEVLAEGFHIRLGDAHAERNAILSARKRDLSLQGSTLYVNLEPCSHFGLTPPCADLIVESGISRVVCCNDDPNPLVAGRGFAKLQDAGIEVVRHVLEEEGRELNRRFFTFMEQHRPYVILKWAESADGFLAPKGNQRYWITNECQNRLNHRWRTEEAAILVGSQTFLVDQPQLTARHFMGPNPLPIVWDRRGRISNLPPHWLRLSCVSVSEALSILYEQKVQSLIVEGGRAILDAFINEGVFDEVRVLRNPNVFFYDGLKAPQIPPCSRTLIIP